MPKYAVTFEEIAYYEVTVEAKNEKEAAKVAEQAFIDGEQNDYFICVDSREVSNIQKITT